MKHQGTAGFSPFSHLPGFHFGYLFLTHSHLSKVKVYLQALPLLQRGSEHGGLLQIIKILPCWKEARYLWWLGAALLSGGVWGAAGGQTAKKPTIASWQSTVSLGMRVTTQISITQARWTTHAHVFFVGQLASMCVHCSFLFLIEGHTLT